MSGKIHLKSEREIEAMKPAGRLTALTLNYLADHIKPGITAQDLNDLAHEFIVGHGGIPTCLGYGEPPFPGSICISVDDVVVHGVPSESIVLKEGSIISLDLVTTVDGWMGDAARTFPVGQVSKDLVDLMRVTEECFWKAFALAEVGNRLGDMQEAIQTHAESHGYGVVRDLTGHGIGRDMHEEPSIPNFGKKGRGLRLQEGMVIAVEPMINMGTPRVYLADDDWSIITADHKPSAHYENTFAITKSGPVLLTTVE